MEIILRKDALARGLPQYFTGKPCRNGHTTYRYTSSGTCAGCVSMVNGRDVADTKSIPASRRQALSELVTLNLMCRVATFDTVRETAANLCLARFPILSFGDVICKTPGTNPSGGLAYFRILVPLQDAQFLRDVSKALIDAGGADAEAERNRIHRELMMGVEEEANNIPRWTERP